MSQAQTGLVPPYEHQFSTDPEITEMSKDMGKRYVCLLDSKIAFCESMTPRPEAYLRDIRELRTVFAEGGCPDPRLREAVENADIDKKLNGAGYDPNWRPTLVGQGRHSFDTKALQRRRQKRKAAKRARQRNRK